MIRTKFTSPALVNFAFLLIALFSFGASYYFLSVEDQWPGFLFVAFGLFSLAAWLESLTSCIRLEQGSLYLRSRFTAKCIPRSDIDRVTWEKGSGVSVKLLDGSWVQMPELFQNSQSLSNSIRAWLGNQNK